MLKRSILVLMVLLLSVIVAIAQPASSQAQITIEDLGSLAGDDDWAAASDINDLSQVVGSSYTPSGGPFAVLWEDGVITNLGGLATGQAYAINNVGQVVGNGYSHDWSHISPILWEDGNVIDLSLGPFTDMVWDINDLGQIVGSMGRAILWENRVPTILAANYEARGINNLGQIVGTQSLYWEDGNLSFLNTPGDSLSINDIGQIVGSGYIPQSNTAGAWFWDAGVVTGLGTLGGVWSEARDINNLGQVVGYSRTSNNDMHAFLWQDGTMIDLGTLVGGTESQASGINNLGQVVGYSTNETGQIRPVMWTVPTSSPPPEEQIGAIIDAIVDLVDNEILNNGQGTALISKLDNVLSLLAKGKTTPGCNLLNAFINQVTAFVEIGALTPEDGESLTLLTNSASSQICQ